MPCRDHPPYESRFRRAEGRRAGAPPGAERDLRGQRRREIHMVRLPAHHALRPGYLPPPRRGSPSTRGPFPRCIWAGSIPTTTASPARLITSIPTPAKSASGSWTAIWPPGSSTKQSTGRCWSAIPGWRSSSRISEDASRYTKRQKRRVTAVFAVIPVRSRACVFL